MNKQIFLNNLKQKLNILNTDEIQDILSEYSGYIDDAMSDGKSEEEAINDFGNIDELAQEILSAYKINIKHAFKSGNTREKVDDFVKDLASIMSELVNYFLHFFQIILKNYSVDNIAQILVLVVVGFVIIAAAGIPFWIIKLIGDIIINIVIPIGFISHILIFIWRLIIGIIQIIFSVLIIVSLIRSGMEKKSVSDSLQAAFKFDNYGNYFKYSKKKVNEHEHSVTNEETFNHKNASKVNAGSDIINCEIVDDPITLKSAKAEVAPTTNEIIDVEVIDEKSDHKQAENANKNSQSNETIVDKARREYRKKRNDDFDFDFDNDLDDDLNARPVQTKKERNVLYSILHLCYLLMAGIIALSTLPLYLAIIILSITFAFGVYLAASGVQIISLIIILLGTIILLNAIAEFILKFIGFSKNKFKYIFLSFMASMILLGVGSVYGFVELNSYEYPVAFTENNVTVEKTFPKGTEFENNYLNQLANGISANGKDIQVKIIYNNKLISNVELVETRNNKISVHFDRINTAKSLYAHAEYFINGLKKGIIYTINDIEIILSE